MTNSLWLQTLGDICYVVAAWGLTFIIEQRRINKIQFIHFTLNYAENITEQVQNSASLWIWIYIYIYIKLYWS